ncbi:MAG TPA: YidC/Oxa1 family membrane protein insertase [Candidatus Faecousia excrementipullorum]|nr:YidC/Oxa1 family membrane protein insertase [Candidatus Faecousia excrementipullorum]
MILAFQLSDLITIPFGYLLGWLYQLTSSYGLALILFAILVKLVLMPASAKGKKSTMKMSRLTPQMNLIREKYANDQQKMNTAIQELYKKEGVSMTGGCLWSLLPLLVLLPLYSVVRQPIIYMLHESMETTSAIMNTIKEAMPDLVNSGNLYYEQMLAAPLLPQFAEELKGIVSNPQTLEGLNFQFLGIDLARIPNIAIWNWDNFGWANWGLLLMPVLSVASQFVSMFVMQKMNNSLVTNEKGIQDQEAAKESQMNKTNKTMMYIMPLMTLWIGFTVPAALSLYWFIQGVVSTVSDAYLTARYRKIYDAEDAERLKRALEEERLEMEKERLRAQKRAENPDGITENTSKKKLQKAQQREEAAAKAAAQREYAAKRGIILDEPEKKDTSLSGIPSRPYCKGRAYDPNRYHRED